MENKYIDMPIASKNALIIFTRNPELGKVKTRLAITIGDESALEIYKLLINHIVEVSENINVDKYVFYSENIQENDVWNNAVFNKELQKGDDLGIRMKNAFEFLFNQGYNKVIIVGSDIYEITPEDIENAFSNLKTNDFVIGPAGDGGYYLLGMKQLKKELFENKAWGTNTVFEETIKDLKSEKVSLLSVKSDVDVYEDILGIKAFKQFFIQP